LKKAWQQQFDYWQLARNQVVISGELALQQFEANGMRQVQCGVNALAFAGVADKVAQFAAGQNVIVR
jgi:hypothetical protein